MVSGTFNVVRLLLLSWTGGCLCEDGRTLRPGQLRLARDQHEASSEPRPACYVFLVTLFLGRNTLKSCWFQSWSCTGHNLLCRTTINFPFHWQCPNYRHIHVSKSNTSVMLRSRKDALQMMDVGAQSLDPVWPIITSPKRVSLAKLITCLPVPTFLGTKCVDGWRGHIQEYAGGGEGVNLEGDGRDLFLWSWYRQTIHRRKW